MAMRMRRRVVSLFTSFNMVSFESVVLADESEAKLQKRCKPFRFGKKKTKAKARGRNGGRKPKAGPLVPTEPVPSTSNLENTPTATTAPCGPNPSASSLNDSSNEAADSTAAKKLNVFKSLFQEQSKGVSDQGYFLIHQNALVALVNSMACPSCFGIDCHLEILQKKGSSFKLCISCNECGARVFKGDTSPDAGKRKDINTRLVLAAKETGIGFQKLSQFFGHLDMQEPMHLKSFQDISAEIHSASVSAAEDVMNLAAAEIHSRSDSGTSPPVVTVSYDGTWQKRGHSSHHGVGIAIELHTGLVVDSACISNYCHGCEIGPKSTNPLYVTWKANHLPQCQKNFDGSSNAMETRAAEVIWDRSIQKRNLIYGTILCDGDAKAHHAVVARDPYKNFSVTVTKEDCVNHIAKRMYNALDTLKKNNKTQLNRKLTKVAMEKITNTYACNLKDNAPNVEAMRQGVLGGIYHMMSTDKDHDHSLCPMRDDSWCWFNKAVAQGVTPTRKHKQTFTKDVGKFVMPVVDRLTDPTLLGRCANMTTQNNNECFNSLIWKRCPKTEFASRQTIETAVALATLAFNCGPQGLLLCARKLGLYTGQNSINKISSASKSKLQKANIKRKRESRYQRKNKKKLKLQKDDERAAAEGETYGAGQFNE